jgi:DNA polymerase-3 subunit epsilon
MSEQKYAIIDIETTGGHARGHRITEIAIIIFDGKQVLDRFSSLINPERSIPPQISMLTGITNDMVRNAPKFYEIAKTIVEMTEGCIFVAHNVFFDYNFIQGEFRDLGYQYKKEKLCTVRLARKIIPGYKSYSLGKICADLKIPLQNRHRAMGDAEATVELFKLLLKTNSQYIEDSLNSDRRAFDFPSQFNVDNFHALPESPGIYYFWSEKNEVLYVGKSINIKKRVASHFRVNIKRQKDVDLKNKIADVTFLELGNELTALLYESQEIKRIRPKYNHALNRGKFPYALKLETDDQGFYHMKVTQSQKHEFGLKRFSSRRRAQNHIDDFYSNLVGVPRESILFIDSLAKTMGVLGVEGFNRVFENHIDSFQYPHDNCYIQLKGRTRSEKVFLHIQDQQLRSIQFRRGEFGELVEEFSLTEDQDMRNILLSYISKKKVKILPIQEYQDTI